MTILRWPARAALLIVCAALLSACGGKQDRLAHHLEKGQAFLANDDVEKARVEYKNVLQIDPKNVAGNYGMGQIMEAQQNWRGAVGYYQRAVELDATADDAKVRLARLFLLGGAIDKSLETINEVLAKSPSNANAMAVKAGILARKGDIEAALAQARAALAIQPNHQDALMLIAGYYTRDKKYDDAIALLGGAITHNAKDNALRLVLAQAYAQRGDVDKATDVLREIAALEPDKLAHYRRLAEFQVKNKHPDDAEATLRAAVDKQAGGVEARLALADFLFAVRGFDAAEKQLQTFIAAEPKDYALQFALAHVYASAKKPAQVKKTYQEIIAGDGVGKDGLRARARLAAIAFIENSNEDGDRLVAEILNENPKDNDALMLRATRALTMKDTATAVADARTVLKDQPQSVDAALLLAEAHVANNEPQLAREVLQTAVDANPRDAKVRFALVKLLAQSGDVEHSIDNLKALVEAAPDNLVAREVLFKAYVGRSAFAAANAVAEQLKVDFPDRALGAFLSGSLAQQQGNYAKSIAEYDAALRIEPRQIEPLVGLIRAHLAQKKPERAQMRLREAIRQFPKEAVLHNLLGEVLIARRDNNGAEEELRKAIELNPRFATPYRNLAEIRTAAGDAAGAIKVYEQGIAATAEGDLSLSFALAALLESRGDVDGAIARYAALLTKDPSSAAAANNLAMLLVTYKQDARSLDRAAQLVEQLRGSRNPAHLDTLGWVYYKRSDNDNAVSALDEAVRVAPNEPVLRYHLGMALYKKGDMAGARDQLTRAVNAKRQFSGVDEARATLNRITG